MKTILLLLTLSFLLNCYTYQSAVTESGNSGYDPAKTYELQLNDRTKTIAKNLVKSEETYTFTGSDGKEATVNINSVKMIRERTFSKGKTLGLTLGIVGAAATVVVVSAAIALSAWDVDWGE